MAYIETNTLKQGLILFGTICDPNGRPFPLYHVQSHLPCKPFNAPRIWLRCDVFLPYWRCVFFTSCYSETFDLWEILYVRVFPSLILLVISWNFGIGKTVQLLVIPFVQMNFLFIQILRLPAVNSPVFCSRISHRRQSLWMVEMLSFSGMMIRMTRTCGSLVCHVALWFEY